MSRKVQIIAASILTIGVAAVFYYAFIDPQINRPGVTQQELNVEEKKPEFTHPLTGVPRIKGEEIIVASIMFDNFSTVSARPGLENVSIAYEALAEGGITRIMGIFDTAKSIESIGPIRSVRPYFIDWALEYGGILMHVGGSPAALRYLRNTDEILDIDQIGKYENYFTRENSLDPPHNVFTDYTSWLQIIERYDVSVSTFIPWKFAEEPIVGSDTMLHQIEIGYFPDNKVAWVYNADKNNYIRFLNGERQYFDSGMQIETANVILIEVDSRTIDSIGRQDMDTIGSGDVAVYRGGKIVTGRWIKDSETARMRFVGNNQEEIALNPGVTWVQVIPSFDIVEYRETFR